MNEEQGQQILRGFEEIDVVAIALTIAISWAAIALVQWFFPWITRRLPDRFRFYILPLVPSLRLLILAFALLRLMALVIQPSIQNIITIAGALAVAIGFAFKDYASSIVAGIVATYERPYRPGDWVEIDGDYGEVKSIGLRAMRMVTPDDSTIIIPHSRIWENNVSNANDGNRDHMCIANFYVHPDHDAALVRNLFHNVAIASPYTQLDRPIVVIVMEKPWGTHYRLKAYPYDGRDEFLYISDLTVRGKTALAEQNIKLASIPPGLWNENGGTAI